MNLVVVGLSHKTAPVALRERFAVPDDALGDAAGRVRLVDGCRESFVVSTCNRVEVYAAFDGERPSDDALTDVLASVGQATRGQVSPHAYLHAGPEAVRHLFRVADNITLSGWRTLLGPIAGLKGASRAGRRIASTGDKAVHHWLLTSEKNLAEPTRPGAKHHFV
jgi:glutamyl-tRNA reductase